nr:uncharacterized protein LOC125423962 [Ziziphus jujuba var. spinosa]
MVLKDNGKLESDSDEVEIESEHEEEEIEDEVKTLKASNAELSLVTRRVLINEVVKKLMERSSVALMVSPLIHEVKAKSYICDYISLLDHLINTAEDVELLVEKRIVDNLLGSNHAVADLVIKLCDLIVESGLCYGTICNQLNEHHDNFWNVTNKTILKRFYFKDLWTSSSSIVAFFVLLFSVVSVIVSIQDMTTW